MLLATTIRPGLTGCQCLGIRKPEPPETVNLTGKANEESKKQG